MLIVENPSQDQYDALCARASAPNVEVRSDVAAIIEAVKTKGDVALNELTARFDSSNVESIRVTLDSPTVDDGLSEAILVASRNIEAFHEAQREPVKQVETSPGVFCWRKSVPLERVGIYIPGGSAPLFSTVLMLALPARLAGCPEIALCTPPREDGTIHPAILFAAQEAGVTEIYAVGGAQAIAAMAYGTESIRSVDKIFGPGNIWVDTAKQMVSSDGVAIDLPAGPTEVALLIDATANPAFVAADMLAQAEHDVLSDVLVVALEGFNVAELEKEVASQLASLPRKEIAEKVIARARVVLVDSTNKALALINRYAPEHLIIQMHHAELFAEQIQHAGSVFIGEWTPESLGDYASGTNHTLPTNGAARAFSGVSLDSFMRKITFQRSTAEGLLALGPKVITMAQAEELDGHARAVEHRLADVKGSSVTRSAYIRRATKETNIAIQIDLDGKGRADCRTGLEFFDHMLDQIARHSGMDLSVRCDGDLQVDEHHTIEDTAIALGNTFNQALGDKRGIGRYGFDTPMDDALARVALDLSGRNWLVWDVELTREMIGDVPSEMFSHFFKSFCDGAGANLNIQAAGDNEHHVVESIFKAFARALGMAIARTGDPNVLPSTKGTL